MRGCAGVLHPLQIADRRRMSQRRSLRMSSRGANIRQATENLMPALYRLTCFHGRFRAEMADRNMRMATVSGAPLPGQTEHFRARAFRAGRVSVMGRNALDALGQQITGRKVADVTQADNADHPLALVD